MNMFKLLRSIQ